jgi:hypothetical protein
VGRLVPHKRLDLLLRALPRIIEQHPRIQVVVIGEGSARLDLEELAAELGVDQHVTFHGHLSSAKRDVLVSCGWLAVNPSVGEGWGLSIIEANAAGLPAVCFSVDGLRDAVRSGDTGWIADHADDLSETIVHALNVLSDDTEATLWSSRAREWAASFSWEATASTLSNILLAESDRRSQSVHRRRSNDLALRVTVNNRSLNDMHRGRRTDVWLQTPEGIEGLLYGLDERDLVAVLERMQLGPAAVVRVARTQDLLLTSEPVELADVGASQPDDVPSAAHGVAQ